MLLRSIVQAIRRRRTSGRPAVSFVVVVYSMPEQAKRTIRSLCVPYQRGVRETDYEVIVVENRSQHLLGEASATELGANVRYYLRDEKLPTPVHAANYGASQARGSLIVMVIDGARLVTPGVVRNMFFGHRMAANAIVCVPSYHLGSELQQEAVRSGYDAAFEAELLTGIDWPNDGYRLFDIACFSGSYAAGFLSPNSESNCLGVPRWLWQELGGVAPEFCSRGGGFANLDLYRRACEHPRSALFVTPGEGCFHQFHGGVTTGGEDAETRERLIAEYRREYEALRGVSFEPPKSEPHVLGHVPAPALRFLDHSVARRVGRREPQAISDAPHALVRSKPELSIVVIGYKMAAQLANTLYSLSTAYQRRVDPEDYEVIVVENRSSENMDERLIDELSGQFRFFRREEPGVSPVPAINFAFSQCRGASIGLMIDGARMLTPRVVYYALMAMRMSADHLVAVPGYHLGTEVDETGAVIEREPDVDQKLLAEIGWKHNGYVLFDVSSWSPANPNGFFHPLMECNCLFASRQNFDRIGGADSRFDLKGGGAINLHMYRKLAMLPETQIVVLPGEGSFHQSHGGVTTSVYAGREAEVEAYRNQLQQIWGGDFRGVTREALILGAIPPNVHPFLQASSSTAVRRAKRLAGMGATLYQDDEFLAEQASSGAGNSELGRTRRHSDA